MKITQLTHWTEELPVASLQAEVPEGGWPINWNTYDQLLESVDGDAQEAYVIVLEAAAQLKQAGDLNQASFFYSQAMAFKTLIVI